LSDSENSESLVITSEPLIALLDFKAMGSMNDHETRLDLRVCDECKMKWSRAVADACYYCTDFTLLAREESYHEIKRGLPALSLDAVRSRLVDMENHSEI
jgi:hypothetical protein